MLLLAIAPLSIGFVALAAGAVAALFALHHLRVQPARQPIATLIFWRAAIRPQRTRVPWSRRFTHRRTFALLAAILLLTAAALVADQWGALGGADRRDVVVVDAGAAMSADDGTGRQLLRRAADAARADVGRLSAGTALVAAGEQPVVLSRGDEPAPVVRRRLDLLAPGSGASASALALQLARGVQGSVAGDIHWYTAQDQLPAGLPDDVARRVRIHPVAPATAVAIVGVTFQPLADDPAHGTLTVRCAGRSSQPIIVRAQVDRGPAAVRTATVDAGATDVTFAGLPADGRSVAVQLIGAPGPAGTHEASVPLPDNRPLTFRFMGEVPPPLRAAALSLGTEADAGRIVIAGRGAAVPADATAAVVIVDSGETVPAGQRLAFPAAAPWGRGLSLEDGTADGSVLTTPGEPVLTAGPAAVASLDRTPACRTLYVARGLLDPSADLPRRAAFPVLLDRLFHELVSRSSPALAVAALRSAEDPLWPGPPDAPAPTEHPVALPDPPPLALAATAGPAPMAASAGRRVPWAQLVLGVALALMVVESLLLAAKKIV